MRGRRHATIVAAALCAAAMMLVTAGCTNSTTSGGSPTQTTTGNTTGTTKNTIRIGWPTIDQSALVQAGLATDFGNVTKIAHSIVADWNRAGGVHGRKVELVPSTFGKDIANLLPDMQKSCLQLTEDDKVFAVAAQSWFGDAVTCVAGDHDTPLLDQSSMARSVLDTGHDNIFLANSLWEDALAGSVRVVDAAGELDGFERIGVFGQLEPGMREAIDNGLKPALEAAGAKLDADGTIPFAAQLDNAAIASVVSRFKADHVDAVFAVGNFYVNGTFMTEAQKQGFHPIYVMSDLSEGTDDLILRFAPAAQLDNAIGASWKGKPPEPVPTAAGKKCIETYAPTARGSVTQEIGAAQMCELMDLLHRGLEGAGESLTRAGFIHAMENIGAFTASGGGRGSFGSDDHTMPDQVRLVRFDRAGCKCWTAAGDWVDVNG